MHKYKPIELYFDPEIEKIARRLRKEHRNLKDVVDIDDLQDMRNLDPRGQ